MKIILLDEREARGKKSCRTGSLNIPALSESQVKRIMDIVDENPKN